jgi:hypothetical protein
MYPLSARYTYDALLDRYLATAASILATMPYPGLTGAALAPVYFSVVHFGTIRSLRSLLTLVARCGSFI